MRVFSVLSGHDIVIVDQEIPDEYDSNSEVCENRLKQCFPGIVDIDSYQLNTSGLFFIETSLSIYSTVKDHFFVGGENIMLGFMLEGAALGDLKNPRDKSQVLSDTHVISYSPTFDVVFEMVSPQEVTYVSIILSKDFYFKLINREADVHSEFVANITSEKHAFFGPTTLKVTTPIRHILHDIRSCTRKGILKRIFIEAKIREMLVLQLEQLQGDDNYTQDGQLFFSEAELKKVSLAKEILKEELANPPLLVQLAKRISLNEFKLKKAFKQQYGITVYQYIVKSRMETAILLLKQGKYSVGEIAYRSGYTDGSNFTAAFKAFYGFKPTDVKAKMANWKK